jgi:long-chain-fatty-acid--CoA ligase ACSBG
MEAFDDVVVRHGDAVALRVERNGVWQEHTWKEYQRDCNRFAKACLAVGLQRFDAVSIIGFNAPEWLIANIGAIFAGGMAAGIYTTNNAESTWYIAHHSKSRIAVAEDSEQVDKFISTKARLPALTHIVQYTGTVSAAHAAQGVLSWADFLALGDSVSDAALAERKRCQRPGQCCTLIYTSGTTGTPKAVMISHDNATWTASSALGPVAVSVEDRIVSYLPLSHVAAQIVDVHIPMATGASLSFAQPDALKGSLVTTLTAVEPTLFLGVPRVWEKIEEKMKAVGAAGGAAQQAVGAWAKRVGLAHSLASLSGEPSPWGYTVAEKLVFSNVKKALGLGKTRLRLTSAAPITKETLSYFMSLDLPILEVYGMSESTGPHTVSFPDQQKLFSVGRPFPGAEQRLHNRGATREGEGEICMWGRHVFMGYMGNEEATAGTVDAEGLLHTGDLGREDDGYLFITGRLKELLITAGGENVAPVAIEDHIKEELPLLANAMVVGDARKFLSVLLTIKAEPDAEGNPTDMVAAPAVAWLQAQGVAAEEGKTTVTSLLRDEAVRLLVNKGIERANKHAVSAAQKIQKWALLPKDFSLATGELTPTLKLKRRVVLDINKELVDSLYTEAKL